ncbi:uncharacterized protein EI97DRAFT_270102 [Westerdykella ornata]|uniref:DUF7730 domain-containing protein n=1 Tax=Westerdykella ornata TaxID=318751 RepID=A0A6A6J5E0_WESOR|nr:uncharacterized protein EI97DRAFT_270102 [Westerdykella ornata]KAF2271434.1 hypothetical protein EI97DRAFT_270102 [Westerdykella ornata]
MLKMFVDGLLNRKVARRNLARQRREDQRREYWSSRLPNPGPKYSNCISPRGKVPAGQEDSIFFVKLPLELRIAIYQRLYGDLTVTLSFFDDPDASTFRVKGNHEEWLFSFPKTCLLAYLESTECIYKCITFHCREIACMQILPCFIAPTWLQTIQSLRVHFPVKGIYNTPWQANLPPQNEETWEKAWDVISSMQGLKSLVVNLTAGGTLVFEHTETQLSKTLKKACGVQTYLVSIDWPPSSSAFSDTNSTPWELELRHFAV